MRIGRPLATSLGALALALAPATIAALPAAGATPGYHAAYFSESSFLTLSPGQTGQFAVGFSNTGDQGWVKGSSAQASLHTAAPLDNTADFTAGWSVSWAAGNIYAYQSTDLVAPSQIGFFVYNVRVPTAAALGVKNFYGRPAIDSAGVLEDYGYYQAVNVQTSALTITATTPASPSTSTTPTITGTGAPAGATVTVKDAGTTVCTATASSTGSWTCGSSALSGGSHSLVASAPGVGDSAAFTYVVDTSTPTVSGASTTNAATLVVTFSKAMKCTTDGALGSIATASNYAITTSPAGSAVAETITVTVATGCSQSTLVLSTPLTVTASYVVTVSNVTDASGNAIGTSRTATFTVTDTGVPTATAIQTGNAQITVTYSKAMDTSTTGALATYKLDSVACATACSSVTTTSTTAVINLTTAPTIANHVLDITGAKDASANLLSPNPTSITIAFTASTTRPTVTGATAVNATKINVTFSTSMDPASAQTASNYTIQKADGNTYSSVSTATCNPSTATCTSVDLVPSTSLISQSYNVAVGSASTPIKDTYNNILSPTITTRGPFPYTLDTSPPTVSSISASQTVLGTASLSITFSKAMKTGLACGGSGAPLAGSGANVENKGDYSIAVSGSTPAGDAAALNAALGASTSAAISGDCKSVTFTLNGNFVAHATRPDYTLSLASVQDQSGNQIVATNVLFTYVDTTLPALSAATWMSASQFSVTYSKTMKGGSSVAGSAGNPNNYVVNNGSAGALCATGSPTITAVGNVWTIACSLSGAATNGVWTGAGSNTVTVNAGLVQDYNGNYVAATSRTF